jgi:hypothetical protein
VVRALLAMPDFDLSWFPDEQRAAPGALIAPRRAGEKPTALARAEGT